MSASDDVFKVCLLGSPAAGKTCFIAGLAILGEPDRNSPFTIAAKGASHQYLRELAKTLRAQAWPPPTNVTEKIDAVIQFRGSEFDLTLLDYPGGHYKDYLASCDTSTIRQLEQTYREADVFLMLLEPKLDILGHDGMSKEAREQLIERQTAHIQSAMHSLRREGAPADGKVRIGLVVTKSDRHPELSTPASARKFVETHAPNLLDRIDMVLGTRGKTVVFPVSAIGPGAASGDNPPPPKVIEPSGYEELFGWLDRLRWWKRWGRAVKKAGVAGAAVSAAALLFLTWVGSANYSYRDEMTSSRKSAQEKLAMPEPWLPLFVSPADLRLAVARAEAARIGDKAREAVDLSQLEELDRNARKIIEARPPAVGDFEQVLDDINKRQEAMLFDMVTSARNGPTGACLDLCDRYLQKFPSGLKAGNVQKIQAEIRVGEVAKDELAIGQIVCANANNMLAKADLVDAYLKKRKPQEAAAMQAAVALARQLAQNKAYTLTTKSMGGLLANYNIIVNYSGNGFKSEFKSLKAGNQFQWPAQSFPLQWKAGDRIALEILDAGWVWNNNLASFGFPDDFDSLLRLLDPVPLIPGPKYPQEKAIRIEIEITAPDGAGIKKESHKAFRDYIHPGTAWGKGQGK